MPNTLQSAIADLASTFAASVVAAIRGASLEDILAVADTRAAGRPAAPAASHAEAAPVRRGPGRPKSVKPAVKAAAPAPAKQAAKTSPKAAPKPAAKSGSKASKSDRLKRRSPDDIAHALSQVVDLLKKNTKGLRAEQIRAELKMESKEMPRILKEGLGKKALKSKGQKRSTTYFA